LRLLSGVATDINLSTSAREAIAHKRLGSVARSVGIKNRSLPFRIQISWKRAQRSDDKVAD
jgi:hypothetical protein